MFKREFEKNTCPLLQGACIESKCKFWVHLLGKDPQTGKDVDDWECAISWIPILLVEVAKETRQGAAATESFRNEVVKKQEMIDVDPRFLIGGPNGRD